MDTLLALLVWGTSGPLSDPSIQPTLTYMKLWFAVNVAPKFRNLLSKSESEA